MLEADVDEKYYLNTSKIKTMSLKLNYLQNLKIKEYSNTIRCGERGSLDIKHTWDLVIVNRIPLKFLHPTDNEVEGEYAYCIDTHNTGGVKETYPDGIRIRRLTPKECFRLMGFDDSDFDKITGISKSQLYKMAGNSIVVNVLESILKELVLCQKI